MSDSKLSYVYLLPFLLLLMGKGPLSVDRKLRGCCPIWLSEGQGAYTQSDAMFTPNMPFQEVKPYDGGYRTFWGSGNGVQRVAVERMEQTPDSA